MQIVFWDLLVYLAVFTGCDLLNTEQGKKSGSELEAPNGIPEYRLKARQPIWEQGWIVEVIRQKEMRLTTNGSISEVAFIFRIYDSKTGALLNMENSCRSW